MEQRREEAIVCLLDVVVSSLNCAFEKPGGFEREREREAKRQRRKECERESRGRRASERAKPHSHVRTL